MRITILMASVFCLNLGLQAGQPLPPTRPLDATKPTDISKSVDSKRWKTGFIVTLKGDTIMGKIKTLEFLDVYYDYQLVVSFRDAKGISQYSSNDIRSFSFYEEANSLITMQSVSSPEGNGLVFLKRYSDGPCKVYGYTVTGVRPESNGQSSCEVKPALMAREQKYIQIKNSQFFPIKRIGFKKNMKEIFTKYPHIISGLNSGAYTYIKWQDLVRDYNQSYN